MEDNVPTTGPRCKTVFAKAMPKEKADEEHNKTGEMCALVLHLSYGISYRNRAAN